MNKKMYTYLLIIGTILFVSILPLFNYTVDRWRILHNDYSHYYAGQTPNKTFLKTKYLIENPKKATTLLMGSSNGGYINANLIKKDAYNMKYNFGLLAIHLQNLKTMLKKGVKIDTLWVGINDYIIWKDPKDYEESFERSCYKADFFKDLETYVFYLFRKPEMIDWYLYRGRYTLLDSEIITHPHPHTEAKKREIEHQKHLKEWKNHMHDISPTLLRYDDSTYRIDDAIFEIQELKKLCQVHNIDLTLFMYPVFYKAYLEYNQDKIEEFKRKLVHIMPFYDFYRLNNNAYDAIKWQDSMHFSYSMGNFIIDSIKNKISLITEQNIDTHLSFLHKEAKEHLIMQEGIFAYHSSFKIEDKKILFDLTNIDNQYINKNNHFTIKRNSNNIIMNILGPYPTLILPPLNTKCKKVFLTIEVESKQKTLFRIYYKNRLNEKYNESRTFRYILKRGKNKFSVAIPSIYTENGLRINLADVEGKYLIKKFIISE